MYSKKVMEHFQHPHNMGEIRDADGIGKIGNPVCGDILWMYLKVGKRRDGKDYIKDIKVKTFGCVAAISTSSAITDMAMGKTLEEAERITNRDIIDVVDGLPPQKIHCSLLAKDALKRAIDDYRKRKRKV